MSISLEEITARYRASVAELITKHGDAFSIPRAELAAVQEANRQDYILLAGVGLPAGDDTHRRAQFQQLHQWCFEHPGETVSAFSLGVGAGVSTAIAFAWLATEPEMLSKIGYGQYRTAGEAPVAVGSPA